jgi:hypothetical protein
MHSSRLRTLALLALTACASGAPGASAPCKGAAGNAVDELRSLVERGPFYRALGASSSVVACGAEQTGGRTRLFYRFRDGGSLRFERDAAVEYANQEARPGGSFHVDAAAVMARAERATFGGRGCGIDWRRPSPQKQAERPRARITVFHGDVCNCQARIAHDERGDLEMLALRSVC